MLLIDLFGRESVIKESGSKGKRKQKGERKPIGLSIDAILHQIQDLETSNLEPFVRIKANSLITYCKNANPRTNKLPGQFFVTNEK